MQIKLLSLDGGVLQAMHLLSIEVITARGIGIRVGCEYCTPLACS